MSLTWGPWTDLYLANQHARNKRQRRTVKGWLRWPFRQLRWPGGEMLP